MNTTIRPAPARPNGDVPVGVLVGVPVGADTHFHGEYTDNTTINGRGADSGTVGRECLASADLAVRWLLDNALGHPKTITVRIDSPGQQHWFELAPRAPTEPATRPATRAATVRPAPARTRTRHHMTEVIRPAVARGDAVRAEVTISSVVRPHTFTVTPHPTPCPHHPDTAGADHRAGS